MVYTLVKWTKITFIKNIDILCRCYYCTEIAQAWNTLKNTEKQVYGMYEKMIARMVLYWFFWLKSLSAGLHG